MNQQQGNPLNVLLLIYPGFTDFEVAVALQLLSRHCQIISVAPTRNRLCSEEGMQILPHRQLDEVNPQEYDALLISAAPDMQEAMESGTILHLIRSMDHQNKLIAAICGAGLLLAKAGILRDRLYTVSIPRRSRDLLGCFDERYFRFEPVIEDENLLTAQGFAFAEFGLRIAERLHVLPNSEAARPYYRGEGDINPEEFL